MSRVCIGVHVHAEPERLRQTLAAIREQTTPPFDLLLLPDGPDDETSRALAAIDDIPQSVTAEPRGIAACFNRLAAAAGADLLVLVESGSIVGPHWLDRLIAALDADPANGLAGPTTNACWNEQAVYRHCAGHREAIADAAAGAAERFGSTTQTLEPLYSLADFCYAVRREVVDAIGAADEGYGLGPCWEMDYNVRAARAGFRGVWARAAYVHRAPFTARRRLEESRRFEASKQLYQDKFCGARRRGEKADYRAHCRGDQCPNFAPQAEKQAGVISVPLVRVKPLEPPPAEPLVSCIMPTCNRRGFVAQAFRCFRRQDYPHIELVVVDDGSDSVADCLGDDPRVRYVHLDRKLTIGAKRNVACSHARGEIIVHWDDDDWYPPWRVGAQVRQLIARGADVCGTSRLLYYDPAAERAWEYRYSAAGLRWLAGNTLAYRRTFWETHRFPDWQVGEDAHFVRNCSATNLSDLDDPHLCIATVHPHNTSPKDTSGTFWHARGVADVQALLGDDVHFYRTNTRESPSDWPLVSCIMPTYNRRTLLPLALQLFQEQDYPNRELIVVDDGDDAIGDLVANAPRVRYVRLPGRRSIGAKRNAACEQAEGDIVAHWDDDDWYAPHRLRYQVAAILADQADMTGLENAFVLDVPGGQFWTTEHDLHRRMFVGDVHGGTLVFRKSLWTGGLRYPDINLAEDAWLVDRARKRGARLLRLSNPGVFVYMRHGRNTWKECEPGRFIDPEGWACVAAPPTFPIDALASYQAATGSLCP